MASVAYASCTIIPARKPLDSALSRGPVSSNQARSINPSARVRAAFGPCPNWGSWHIFRIEVSDGVRRRDLGSLPTACLVKTRRSPSLVSAIGLAFFNILWYQLAMNTRRQAGFIIISYCIRTAQLGGDKSWRKPSNFVADKDPCSGRFSRAIGIDTGYCPAVVFSGESPDLR